MREIEFGKIRIVDVDDNDYFDEKIDHIEKRDEKGSLNIKSPEVQETLKQLGITSFQGLKISSTMGYWDSFYVAKSRASEGDIQGVEAEINLARGYAGQAGFAFQKERASDILGTAIRKGITETFRKAYEESTRGNWNAVQTQLTQAADYMETLSLPFPSSLADRIVERAKVNYQKRLVHVAQTAPGNPLTRKYSKKMTQLEADAAVKRVLLAGRVDPTPQRDTRREVKATPLADRVQSGANPPKSAQPLDLPKKSPNIDLLWEAAEGFAENKDKDSLKKILWEINKTLRTQNEKMTPDMIKRQERLLAMAGQ